MVTAPATACLPGIAFPYISTEVRIDGRRMPLHRMRVDKACRRSPDRKYESPPKAKLQEGLPFHIYVPPGVAERRKRTDVPIWITEGEKKALVLTQYDQPCLGLPGVFLFTDPLDEAPHAERRLHPDLARWHWRDRVVFVCFDSDRLDNEQVALAHERLCAKLAAEGARVRVVDSASLAALLTATTWADRRLGETTMLALPNHALWLATGNNPMLSRELARRAVRIRLDAGSSTPWTGRRFRHPDLPRWVEGHRRELVCALLGLIAAWLEAGRPDAGARLGSYEDWARVVGSVLAHAGFTGFLEGDALETIVDPEEAEWAALVAAWGQEFGTVRLRASELLQLAQRCDLSIAAADRSEHATRARFGKGLAQRRQRVYGRWRLCDGFDAGRKQRVYWLAAVG